MGRRWIVWTVLGVALALLLASSLSVWVKRQALETDNWVEASTQLLQNDEVREAVAVELVDALFSATDVEAQLQEALPSELEALAGPAAGLVYSAALTAAEELLQLPATQALWEEANRRAHERLVAILEGDEDGAVQADDGGVVLDLQELVVRLAEQLGVEVTPSDSEAGQITIVQSDQLAAAQTAVQALEILSVLTFLAVLVLLVLAVALARGFRREALRALALGVTGIGIVLLVVRRLVGEVVVDSLTTASTRESGSAVWAIGTSLLGDLALGLVVLGLVLLAGVVLAGPTRWATALRRGVAPAVRAHPPLIHAVVAGVVLLLLLWGPDAGGRRLFAVLLLAALALTGAEILRRQILRESSSAGDRPGPP
ncbi:MAG: hypothetical protein MUE51_11635 [Thermoleophilia bacterium]|nr:hypothetical protein [Thermoleophilia bacterium]